ncbi:ComF family protein [Pseudohongiella spirulinae]|uniref:ComF family protein n=1 Tax=Pseudohongiella spirulinae TaxID=1249552 RepID=UPI00071786FD|nr:ComF family protein [Pseudohongiella spirulinae]
MTACGVCRHCLDILPWQPPGCIRCAVIVPDSTSAAPLCNRCAEESPAFDSCHAVFSYESPIDSQIRQFKDLQGFRAARSLGELLAISFKSHYRINSLQPPDLLVPVPLHTDRLRRRGFNQAKLLADAVHKFTRIPVLMEGCTRMQTNLAQRKLNAQGRLANIGHLFTINSNTKLTMGRRIAIIDDVITTTATARDIADIFRQAGCEHIEVWALARRN